jgi:hypothetical protein
MTMCWGGPLDGRVAPFQQPLAFPWPRGWYYADLRGRYVWRDQPGTFTPKDQEWLDKHLPKLDV